MKKFLFIFIFLLLVFSTPVFAASTEKIKISDNSSKNIVLKNIKADKIIFKNKSFEITSTIQNRGHSFCKQVYLDYFLKSTDNSQIIYIGSGKIVGLCYNETRIINSTFKLSNHLRSADYFIRIVLCSKRALNETNKTNNVFYSLKKVTVVTGLPVYITSDRIKNNTTDNAKINAIVKSLQKKGIYAMNYGLGPNKHYSVLKNLKIPPNALIVNIYGGACAGTIWEMTLPYYKKALGTRKVFSVWINTKINIKTEKFLKRAYDDKNTPKYGTNGGFPHFLDSNKNGKFDPQLGEIDGIANPGKLLEENGYKYLYQQDGNVEDIANAIYRESINC